MPIADRLHTRYVTARATALMLAELPRLLQVSPRNPATYLRDNAARHGGRLALRFEDRRLSWAELDGEVDRAAHWLRRRGVAAGDVVALLMDNRPEYVIFVLAVSRLRATVALINTNLAGDALKHALRVARPAKVLVGTEHWQAVAALDALPEGLRRDCDLWALGEPGVAAPPGVATVDADLQSVAPVRFPEESPRGSELFCYIYTSGTTGLPKAAKITNQRMMGVGCGAGKLMFEATPDDVLYVTLPLYHSSGMFFGLGGALWTGAAIALRRKFSASQFFAEARATGATGFLYIGELCRYLLHTPPQPGERDHRLRVGVGNGLRPDIWPAFQERFGVPLIREFYGSTEGNTIAVNTMGKVGMVGRLRTFNRVIRCDPATGEPIRNAAGLCDQVGEGETGLIVGWISPLSRFDGYVDNAATEKKILRDVARRGDHWFNSGDLVKIHEDQWLSFVDRVGDTFRWKGENVSTFEVAELLGRAPGVIEANVYGVAVPGGDGRAGMVALRVDERFDLEAFAALVASDLTHYQRPYFVRLLQEDMRRTGTFKQQKVDYRDEAYDLDRVSDPLFMWLDGRYVPFDAARRAALGRGEIALR